MNRRSFLIKGTSLLGGYLFGLNSFTQVFACESQTEPFSSPHIAIIIDDIGYSINRARYFLNLNIPLTFSILPRLRHSCDLAKEINDSGHDVMLHQPMEPYDPSLDPGPGALFVGDKPDRITTVIEENISGLPFAKGINNHMGSRFTGSPEEMTEALMTIKDSGLFFIDSRTSRESQGYKLARKLNVTAAYRHLFLDNTLFESAILKQLHTLKHCAQKYGNAIGIGHPFRQTANAIRIFLNEIRYSNLSIVHVSKVLNI